MSAETLGGKSEEEFRAEHAKQLSADLVDSGVVGLVLAMTSNQTISSAREKLRNADYLAGITASLRFGLTAESVAYGESKVDRQVTLAIKDGNTGSSYECPIHSYKSRYSASLTDREYYVSVVLPEPASKFGLSVLEVPVMSSGFSRVLESEAQSRSYELFGDYHIFR
jgi:hypothetical protein